MTRDRITTDKEWLETIKSSMTNNGKPYTTVAWMQIETGKPTKTVRHELDKMVKSGLLIKTTVNDKCVWYKINNKAT